MITSNQIIDRVKYNHSNCFQTDDIKIITNSIMKVRIPSEEITDKLVGILNQTVPNKLNNNIKSIWGHLISNLRGFSTYCNFENINWLKVDGYWESKFVFYGSPIDMINKIRSLPLYKFSDQYYYFDTENKFGFISYSSAESEKWFIRKSCSNYFKVFAHYLKTFKEYLDDGNKFKTNLVERLGTKKMDINFGLLHEEWDNDLYFDLSKDVNFDIYLESFKQIHNLNSELRDQLEKVTKDPWTEFGGKVDLKDLNESITQLEELLNTQSEIEKKEV